MWPTRSTVPLNTLQFKCLQQVTRHCDQSQSPCRPNNWFDETIDSDDFECDKTWRIQDRAVQPSHELRQQLHDHAVRERTPISAVFLCELLQDGGLQRLDLWTLCENSEFSRRELQRILNTITEHGRTLQELSIGGGHWMFDSALTSGPLRRLLRSAHLPQLRRLRLQLSPHPVELAHLLRRCSLLQHLNIVHPSLTDVHLQWLASHVDAKSVQSLTELHLPSSVRGAGLACALLWLPNLRSLQCAHFELMLDWLDECNAGSSHPLGSVDQDEYESFESEEDSPGCAFEDSFESGPCFERGPAFPIQSVRTRLTQLYTLHITQPISADVPARISRLCRSLRCLRLETQEILRLQPLSDLKHLQSLHLHNSSTLGASYLEHVRPLLSQLGCQLTELGLEQFDVVDLNDLSSLCPRLVALSVQWFSILGVGRTTGRWGPAVHDPLRPGQPLADPSTSFILPSRLKHQNLFEHLRCIRLRPRVHQPLQTHLLEFVVCNAPRLRYLECYGVSATADSQWQQMWSCRCGNWTRLKCLIVRHGNELSEHCVQQLMQMADQLMHLECEKPPLSKTDLVPNPPEDDFF